MTENKKSGGLRTKGCEKNSISETPLISVVTVVFNGAATLEHTIRSVIEQSYGNVEYIIVDGGSTDGTLGIIQKYEGNIDYWVSEKDAGIYDAMNKAIGLASGDYYVVVGCDDELFADGLQQVVDAHLAGGGVDFVVASMFLGSRLRTGMRPKRGWLGAHAMVNGHSVGMLIRTKVHEKIGLYSTSYKLASDALMIKKLFYSGLRGVASGVIMGRFGLEGASNSNLGRGLCEGFLVQIETEKFKSLQVLIFIARLFKNMFRFR